MPGTVDLHTHSTASDGSLSPDGLVAAAWRAGLSAVAVTDHDTVGGLPAALRAGRKHGIEVVPGVEVSVQWPPRSLHIVGLFVEPAAGGIAEWLAGIAGGRDARNARILAKLNELGVDLSMTEVVTVAREGNVGRPHIARLLVAKGAVASVQEAFDRYLGHDAPAYVDRMRPSPAEAIGRIHASGGLAILAHPDLYGLRDPGELRQLASELKRHGLDGMEVVSSTASPEEQEAARTIVGALGLLESGGTDYHGDAKPAVRLGVGRGNVAVPYELVETMKAALAGSLSSAGSIGRSQPR